MNFFSKLKYTIPLLLSFLSLSSIYGQNSEDKKYPSYPGALSASMDGEIVWIDDINPGDLNDDGKSDPSTGDFFYDFNILTKNGKQIGGWFVERDGIPGYDTGDELWVLDFNRNLQMGIWDAFKMNNHEWYQEKTDSIGYNEGEDKFIELIPIMIDDNEKIMLVENGYGENSEIEMTSVVLKKRNDELPFREKNTGNEKKCSIGTKAAIVAFDLGLPALMMAYGDKLDFKIRLVAEARRKKGKENVANYDYSDESWRWNKSAHGEHFLINCVGYPILKNVCKHLFHMNETESIIFSTLTAASFDLTRELDNAYRYDHFSVPDLTYDAAGFFTGMLFWELVVEEGIYKLLKKSGKPEKDKDLYTQF